MGKHKGREGRAHVFDGTETRVGEMRRGEMTNGVGGLVVYVKRPDLEWVVWTGGHGVRYIRGEEKEKSEERVEMRDHSNRESIRSQRSRGVFHLFVHSSPVV